MHLLSHNSKADLQNHKIRDDTPPFFFLLKQQIQDKLLFLHTSNKKEDIDYKMLYICCLLACYESFSSRKWKTMTCSPHLDMKTLSFGNIFIMGERCVKTGNFALVLKFQISIYVFRENMCKLKTHSFNEYIFNIRKKCEKPKTSH